MPDPTPPADPAFGPDDPYARESQTFPVLPDEMAARVASYGREERLPAGTPVFERGQRGADFYLVRDGTIEVFDTDAAGDARVFVTHVAGQFTGELDLFNDRAVLVSGRTGGPSRVVRLDRPAFRRLVTGEPDIAEVLIRAFILRRVGLIAHAQGGVVVAGPGRAGETLRLQRFLTRNGYPHRLLDTDTDADAPAFLDGFGVGAGDLPVVILPDAPVLRAPTTAALADALGLTETLDADHVYDLAVVGAGPAGLAAAVYAASEGLDTLVVEGVAPGGQAGTSSRIENYLGFPTGISGLELAARAQVQAQKFGVTLAVSREVAGLDCGAGPYRLHLDDGATVAARAVVAATGARYRTLDVPHYDRYEGQGIHYAATAMEAALCTREEVVVVGGGNSAGQAAMYLSRTAAHVHILVRGDGLAATMSDYLVQRLAQSERVSLHVRTEVVALSSADRTDGRLAAVTWASRDTGERETRPVGNLFVMIGAVPNTAWLGGCLALDAGGFVVTGLSAAGAALGSPYATARPGLFAVGDVRSGSVKRVASGVGEGSAVVQAVHQFLAPAVA